MRLIESNQIFGVPSKIEPFDKLRDRIENRKFFFHLRDPFSIMQLFKGNETPDATKKMSNFDRFR